MSTRRERAAEQSATDRKRHTRPAGLPPCPSAYVLLKRSCGHNQAAAIKCHSPLCPECERERAARIRERWAGTMAALPDLKLLTLTIENGPDLKERITTLYQARRRLLDLRLGRNNRKAIWRIVNQVTKKKLTAGTIDEGKAARWIEQTERWLDAVARTESKNGKSPKVRALMKGLGFLETPHAEDSGTWHAHLHLIVSMRYMPQIVLTVLWHMATNGAGRIVDIRKITNADEGLMETAKYVTKAWEIPEQKYPEVLAALKGVKRVTRIGNIKPAPEQETPCPCCNKPTSECGCTFVAMPTANEAIIPNVFYKTTIYDMGMSYEAQITITRDMHGHMVWSAAPINGGVLSTYSHSVSSEGGISPPGNAPPGPHEPTPAPLHHS